MALLTQVYTQYANMPLHVVLYLLRSVSFYIQPPFCWPWICTGWEVHPMLSFHETSVMWIGHDDENPTWIYQDSYKYDQVFSGSKLV